MQSITETTPESDELADQPIRSLTPDTEKADASGNVEVSQGTLETQDTGVPETNQPTIEETNIPAPIITPNLEV